MLLQVLEVVAHSGFCRDLPLIASQILSNFQIYRYFQKHRVQSQFQDHLIPILGQQSQIGQLADLAGLRSFASQQLAEFEFSWAWRASWYHFRLQVFDFITFMINRLKLSFETISRLLVATAPKSGQRGSIEASSSSECQLVWIRALFLYCLQILHSLSINS